MQRERDQALELINKRLNNCVMDIEDDIPIKLAEELRELKLDLILFALNENMNIATQAAKMLNMNRTTMVSMLHNELGPVIKKRKERKRKD